MRTIFSSDELALFAKVLRMDDAATFNSISTEDYMRRIEAARDAARANLTTSGSDDPSVRALEEIALELRAFVDADDVKDMARAMALVLGFIGESMRLSNEIRSMDVPADNPVTLAALKANGILHFSNPVQQQTLIRRFSKPATTGGIRFLSPAASQ